MYSKTYQKCACKLHWLTSKFILVRNILNWFPTHIFVISVVRSFPLDYYCSPTTPRSLPDQGCSVAARVPGAANSLEEWRTDERTDGRVSE